MHEGYLENADILSPQMKEALNYFVDKEVVGLALGGSDAQSGWQYIGVNNEGLVSLVKKEENGGLVTRDISLDQFLALNLLPE